MMQVEINQLVKTCEQRCGHAIEGVTGQKPVTFCTPTKNAITMSRG